ncbi:MAG: hypothetical protein IT385_21710 [Deltaproteobacteria bacterium]|nr:hypothetical protein [Deltaproteobacteria bacterium]
MMRGDDVRFDAVGGVEGAAYLTCLTGRHSEMDFGRDTVGAIRAQIAEAARVFGDPGEDGVRPLPPAKLAWERLYERAGAACFMAAAAWTPAPARAALLDVLEAWAASPLVREAAAFRVLWGELDRREPFPDRTQGVLVRGGRAWMIKRATWGEATCLVTVLERAPDGRFVDPPGLTISSDVRGAALRMTAEQLARFVARVRREGPPAYDPRIAQAISARTTLTPEAAALVWGACLEVRGALKVTVQPEVRRALGLKVKDVTASEAAIRALHEPARPSRMAQWYNVSRAVMPYQAFYDLYEASVADPEALFAPLGRGPDDDDSPVARLARAWVEAR